MSPRTLLAVTVALLACSATQSFETVSRQLDYNEQLQIFENSKLCGNAIEPNANRLASCTALIEEGKKGNLDANIVAQVYVQRAQVFLENRDDDAALRDFNAAVKSDPKGEQGWLGRANFYLSKANYSAALLDYDSAQKINPNDTAVYDNRGVVLNALGRRDEALADFAHAIALDPLDLVAYSNRATLGLSTGRLDLAIADLSHVISAEPANGMAHYNRGIAYERSGQLDKALDDYRSAMRLQPAFAPAAAALGRLLKDKDPDAALSALSAAIRLDPRSAALRSRATLYLSLGRFDEALRDFNQVIANDGSDAISYLDRGVTNEKLGHVENAIPDYSRSIELAPSAAAYVNRGNAYASQRQPVKALADFDAALALDTNNLPALLGRANANYARQMRAASLDDYTRVIAADPTNAIAFFKRGNVHFDLREFAAAYSDYSDALKLDPTQAVALYNRGLVAVRLGRLKDAAADRRRALALDPSLATGDERP